MALCRNLQLAFSNEINGPTNWSIRKSKMEIAIQKSPFCEYQSSSSQHTWSGSTAFRLIKGKAIWNYSRTVCRSRNFHQIGCDLSFWLLSVWFKKRGCAGLQGCRSRTLRDLVRTNIRSLPGKIPRLFNGFHYRFHSSFHSRVLDQKIMRVTWFLMKTFSVFVIARFNARRWLVIATYIKSE